MTFKNAVCQAPIPDAPGYSYPPYALCCKRRAHHEGKHRVKFADGGVREWAGGDRESKLSETKPTEANE